jgi:hypothetical protein
VSNTEERRKAFVNSVLVIIDGGRHEDLLTGMQKAKEVGLEFMKRRARNDEEHRFLRRSILNHQLTDE